MKKPKQKVKLATLVDCQREISVMVARSKTRLIAPTLTLGLLQSYVGNGKIIFSERETQMAYAHAVKYLQGFMGHGLHIGAKWEDAYSRRTLPKYQVLKPLENGYELLAPYTTFSSQLIPWIENTIRKYIESKLGNIPNWKTNSSAQDLQRTARHFCNYSNETSNLTQQISNSFVLQCFVCIWKNLPVRFIATHAHLHMTKAWTFPQTLASFTKSRSSASLMKRPAMPSSRNFRPILTGNVLKMVMLFPLPGERVRVRAS
jgi:hypothetical protein